MNKILTCLLPAIFIVAGCQKTNSGNSTTTGQQSDSLINTFTLVTYNPTTNAIVDSSVNKYSYDAQSRLVGKTVSDYQPSSITTDTTTIVYSAGSFTENEVSWVSGLKQANISSTFYLNASGTLPDSSVQITYNQPIDTGVSTYSFDTNGYLLKEQVFLRQNGNDLISSEIDCTVSGGNYSKANITSYIVPGNISNSFITATLYSFSNQTPNAAMAAATGNAINGIIGVATNDINLLHGDANLISAVNISANGFSEQEVITYTFDSKGRVSTVLYNLSTGGLVAKAYYTY